MARAQHASLTRTPDSSSCAITYYLAKHPRVQEKLQKERQQAEERELEELGGKDHIEQQLVGMLKKGETVLEALQRLGAKAKKNGATKKK